MTIDKISKRDKVFFWVHGLSFIPLFLTPVVYVATHENSLAFLCMLPFFITWFGSYCLEDKTNATEPR